MVYRILPFSLTLNDPLNQLSKARSYANLFLYRTVGYMDQLSTSSNTVHFSGPPFLYKIFRAITLKLIMWLLSYPWKFYHIIIDIETHNINSVVCYNDNLTMTIRSTLYRSTVQNVDWSKVHWPLSFCCATLATQRAASVIDLEFALLLYSQENIK